MTIEEAIEILKTADFPEDYTVEEVRQALDMAIKTLSAEKTTINPEKTTITDGDLISRQAVLKVLGENRFRYNIAKEGYNGGQVLWSENLYTDNVRTKIEKLPSAEKTAEWISVLEQMKEELSHISKPEIEQEDYENGVYDGVNLAIRTIDKYAGELVHTDISLIKKDILSELEKLENYPSKDNSVFARINTYKRCIGIIDKHIGELEQTAEWEYNSFGDKWRCSKCFQSNNEKTKYCPFCGAKIEIGRKKNEM